MKFFFNLIAIIILSGCERSEYKCIAAYEEDWKKEDCYERKTNLLKEKRLYKNDSILSYRSYDEKGQVDSCFNWFRWSSSGSFIVDSTLELYVSFDPFVFENCDKPLFVFYDYLVDRKMKTFLVKHYENIGGGNLKIKVDRETLLNGHKFRLLIDNAATGRIEKNPCCKRYGSHSDTVWVERRGLY